jgi:hypothetical protein
MYLFLDSLFLQKYPTIKVVDCYLGTVLERERERERERELSRV